MNRESAAVRGARYDKTQDMLQLVPGRAGVCRRSALGLAEREDAGHVFVASHVLYHAGFETEWLPTSDQPPIPAPTPPSSPPVPIPESQSSTSSHTATDSRKPSAKMSAHSLRTFLTSANAAVKR